MSIETQNAEFDAVLRLANVYRDTIQAVPIVDDDYPEARSRYEGALHDLIRALNSNGRDMVYGKAVPLVEAPFTTAAKLRQAIDFKPNSREKSLALTKLDELEMWLERCK